MDISEDNIFLEMEKKTYEEIRIQFQHLTHIGFSSEDIDAYSKKYYEFFQKMKIAKGEFTSSSSIDLTPKELSPSSEPSLES